MCIRDRSASIYNILYCICTIGIVIILYRIVYCICPTIVIVILLYKIVYCICTIIIVILLYNDLDNNCLIKLVIRCLVSFSGVQLDSTAVQIAVLCSNTVQRVSETLRRDCWESARDRDYCAISGRRGVQQRIYSSHEVMNSLSVCLSLSLSCLLYTSRCV